MTASLVDRIQTRYRDKIKHGLFNTDESINEYPAVWFSKIVFSQPSFSICALFKIVLFQIALFRILSAQMRSVPTQNHLSCLFNNISKFFASSSHGWFRCIQAFSPNITIILCGIKGSGHNISETSVLSPCTLINTNLMLTLTIIYDTLFAHNIHTYSFSKFVVQFSVNYKRWSSIVLIINGYSIGNSEYFATK